jgi:RNA polymerase sigma factor (sigma-70 family)
VDHRNRQIAQTGTRFLIMQYAPLVKRIAYHLMAKLPASVQVEDIIQNGMMGLLDAIGRYEEGLGAQFETYAVQRIRGAMLDGLRENDWLPRSLRRDMRRIEAAVPARTALRPPALRGELAEALDMALGDYQKMLQDARGYQLVYLEDFGGEDDDDYLDRHLPSSERPARRAARQEHARRADPGHRGPARAREDGDGPVLRGGAQPARNRRGARRFRVARLPAAQPGHRPPARAHLEGGTPPESRGRPSKRVKAAAAADRPAAA